MRHESRVPWTRVTWAATLVVLALALAACGTTPRTASGPREPEGSMTAAGLANLQLARNYLANGQADIALSRALRAERSDPGSPDVQIVLGMIQDSVGNRPLAGEHYARAVRLAPESGHVLNAQAAWLCSTGQRAEADAVFQRAVADRFYQARDQAYFNAGKCAFEGGDSAAAEAYLRSGLQLSAENPRLLEMMARVKFSRGDYLGARAFFQRRDALGTPGAEMLELAARIEQAAGDAGAAARYRERLRTEYPAHLAGEGEGSP